MEKEKRRALETYLKVSRSLCSMADKFDSIGITIWEGNPGEFQTVNDDFSSAYDDILNYRREVIHVPESVEGNFEKIALDYIFGKNDDFDGTMEQLQKYCVTS